MHRAAAEEAPLRTAVADLCRGRSVGIRYPFDGLPYLISVLFGLVMVIWLCVNKRHDPKKKLEAMKGLDDFYNSPCVTQHMHGSTCCMYDDEGTR